MTVGFRQATVNASLVPSTQTNFPSYVDLSRLGITTLAAARSVRVFLDPARTVQVAREIVSATEMHVRVPTFTNTTTVFVDWDSVRADYAVTDTYGRNAVWSAYQAVQHMEGNSNDSTSNGRNGTDTNISYSAGKIGQTAGTTSGKIALPSFSLTAAFSVGIWINLTTAANVRIAWSTWNTTVISGELAILYASRNTSSPVDINYTNYFVETTESTTTYPTGTWTRIWVTHNGTTPLLYINGAAAGVSGNVLHITTNAVFNYFKHGVNSTRNMDGYLDETYILNSQISANWITTEYNNQNNEASFWGAWTDVGGGANTTAFFALMTSS